ncbi:Uncharacterised protein [Pseudomonas aeruginosa]|nr:Uncharacterised protein [Pseudomonas aeruginosa]
MVAHGPQRDRAVRIVATAAVDGVEGEQHHGEERQRLQRREYRAEPQPVAGHADPEVVVAGADDAADQRHGDDHVEPFLDHLAVDPGDLHQHEGEDRTHDQLPHAFHPQVHHPPPVELVAGEVFRVVEGEQEQQGEADQAGHQDHADGGLAPAQHGHADVEQKAQGDDHDARLADGRLFEELAAHGRPQFVAGEPGQAGVGHQQVAEDGQHTGGGEYPEQDPGQPGLYSSQSLSSGTR